MLSELGADENMQVIAAELHHIILKSAGGQDIISNIIAITRLQHNQAHGLTSHNNKSSGGTRTLLSPEVLRHQHDKKVRARLRKSPESAKYLTNEEKNYYQDALPQPKAN